ncbi:MAG: metallophosphoesterase, partial [Nitrospira sp.]|nr:metallophosphoesterase [Nitrospira sp.]
NCNFIHITDLHVAKRNDEILDEVLKVRCRRDREEIKGSYINFNDNLRKFIGKANEMADNGGLDFVVVTGDLVDFAFLGWEDEVNPDENNWKTFINIITGSGKESGRGNPGLKVALFTSTGNHDWRMHPYNPLMNNTYGLEKEELEHYNYKSFDSTEYPKDERARLSEEITNKAFNKINLDAFSDNSYLKFVKYLFGNVPYMLPFLIGGFGTVATITSWYKQLSPWIVLPLLLLTFISSIGIHVIKWYLKNKTRRVVDLLIDNPLHAEALALHYYLRYINPYFDYAFQYGRHCFIVMDTGSDVFNGELMDKKTVKNIKRMSLEDNVFGGSPDSRGFDSEQAYYNWSQIVWLEKVLEAIESDNGGRTFAFLHSPPINPTDNGKFNEGQLRESNRTEMTKWIPKEECNLTMGTVNHYLSQFFYLCLGYRESELVNQNIERKLKQVDMVFSGHAHRNIEFRIEKDMDNKIRIYYDMYSRIFNPDDPFEWWGKYSPVIVQTASCGVPGRLDKKPPYYRKVALNLDNMIMDFQVRSRDNNF